MFKVISLVTFFLFLVATTLAPFVTSQQSIRSLATEDTTEERTFTIPNFEEEIIHVDLVSSVVFPTYSLEIAFPTYRVLEPQHIVSPVPKPPLV